MKVEFSETDVVFIYGHFLKQLAEINKIESAPNCPLDKTAIKNQKEPYLSVIEKLRTQYPNLTKMDKCF